MIYYGLFFLYTNMYLLLSFIYRTRFFLYLVFLFSFFFSASRYGAGSDYFSYMNIITTNYREIELANLLIIDAAKFFSSPQIYFIVTSFVYIFSIFLALKRIEAFNFLTVFMFLFFAMSFIASFDIIRQQLASSILFLSFSYFLTRHKIRSLLLLIIAFYFHKSSLVFIPVFIYYLLFSKKEFYLFVYIFMPVLFFLFFDKLIFYISNKSGLYTHYFDVAISDVGQKNFLIIFFFYLFLLFFSKLYKVHNAKFWIFFNIFFLVVLLQSSLVSYGYHLARISYIFAPFVYPAVWFLYKEIPSYAKPIYLTTIFIFCLTTYFGSVYIGEENLQQYQLFFLSDN